MDELIAQLLESFPDLSADERTARLAELSPEELSAFNDALLDAYNEAREAERTPETVASMAQHRDGLVAVRTENERRVEAAAELEAEAARIDAEVLGETTETPAEEPAPDGGEGGDDAPAGEPASEPAETPAPAEGDQPAEEATAEEPQPVAAAATPAPARPRRAPVANLSRNLPAAHRPRPRETDSPLVITAAADGDGYSAGRPITLEDMGQAFTDMVNNLNMGGLFNERRRVAKVKVRGEEPVIGPEKSLAENQAILASAMADHRAAIARLLDPKVTPPEALVAAGGICAPPTPLYDFKNVSTSTRPLRGALPRIPSNRGSVIFGAPATIDTAVAGITKWSEANDTTPGSAGPATKPCYTLVCGSQTTVNVDAIVQCLTMGNFGRVTWPEQWRDIWEKMTAAAARVAETKLLDDIDSNSTKVTDDSDMGVTRELIDALIRHAAVRRYHHRMDPTAPVVVALGAWVRDMMRSDLNRQVAGDGTYTVDDGFIGSMFQRAHLLPVWLQEGRTGAGQGFGAIPAGGSNPAWPSTIEAHMWHSEAHFLLDLPEINLGTEVRDSTLNDDNNVQAWMEIFETAGFNGLWSTRIRLANACASGEGGAPTDATTCIGS